MGNYVESCKASKHQVQPSLLTRLDICSGRGRLFCGLDTTGNRQVSLMVPNSRHGPEDLSSSEPQKWTPLPELGSQQESATVDGLYPTTVFV